MAVINHAKREINAKIVYYGREGSGKRAALQYIYDRVRPSLRGKLKTLSTGGDSLTFFDFSPFENPQFNGYNIRFHMYSLTGKVTNPAAWKMTLKGVDGLVIVAGAAHDMIPATRESISQLREFLAAYGVGMHDIPCVLQLNRAGVAEHASADDTCAALDLSGVPVCLSDTSSGDGVLKALSQLSREMMARIGKDSALRPSGGETMVPGGGAATSVAREPEGCTVSAAVPGERGEETELLPSGIGISTAGGDLCASLAGEHATCIDGVIRIPLELNIAGGRHRLVLSVSLDQN